MFTIKSERLGTFEVPDRESAAASAAAFFYDRLGYLFSPPDTRDSTKPSVHVLHVAGAQGRSPIELAFSGSSPLLGAKRANDKAHAVEYNTPSGVSGFYVDEAVAFIFLSCGHLYYAKNDKPLPRWVDTDGDGRWFRLAYLKPLPAGARYALFTDEKSGKLASIPAEDFWRKAEPFVEQCAMEVIPKGSIERFAADIITEKRKPQGRYLLFDVAQSYTDTLTQLRINEPGSGYVQWTAKKTHCCVAKERLSESIKALDALPVEDLDILTRYLSAPEDRALAMEVVRVIPDARRIVPVLSQEQDALKSIIKSRQEANSHV